MKKKQTYTLEKFKWYSVTVEKYEEVFHPSFSDFIERKVMLTRSPSIWHHTQGRSRAAEKSRLLLVLTDEAGCPDH